MTTHVLVILMLVLGMCVLFSAFAGLIGFGIARLIKAPVDKSIGWGSIAALSFMTLCIALLDGVIMPLVT
ncbi:hypothetical protein GCM10010451_64770 [Streptomyces virens]|uniref:Preprotein translocase subunit SecE n=2 Tax=Streptomyces TaxID=1883 RepID=A0A514K038_9ACTN|nr:MULTISPECIES: hypothetical protein [Streptomyces]MBA8946333.1 preprotein translocase subunit SecE [Streptomyces calvus]MBA8980201.1 preprotein translocase subunit SecE [Streptomyces calvus]MYS25810.1 hypothetical protein [Streptomyces sp. SID7804]QDI73003.1 hypothetical protein CD934_33175 [Streptomyces calvus]GGP56186.1 hypothetical protein GCM10010247_31220 [Streptomyces calvus]